MKSITGLRNLHRGRTIYVFGSGGELNELDALDFRDEITIAMNYVPKHWPIRPTYGITKYYSNGSGSPPVAEWLIDAGITTVVSRARYGWEDGEPPETADYVYEHLPLPGPAQTGYEFDAKAHWPPKQTMLLNGPTVAISAMHLAAYLGAGAIRVHGCGGYGHVDGYYPDSEEQAQRDWLDTIRPIVARAAGEIARRYRIDIYGIPACSPC